MFAKILVPYDFSDPSRQAVVWASHFGLAFKSILEVFHALTDDELLHDIRKPPGNKDFLDHVRDQVIDDVNRYVKDLLLPGDRVARLTTRVERGRPAHLILETIQKTKPDIVIQGTHGRTGLKRVLLGSVAENIIRHSPVPVMTVRNSTKWPVRKILLPIDFMEYADPSLDFATGLCRALDATLELFHVLNLPDFFAVPTEINEATVADFRDRIEAHAKLELDRLITRHPGVRMNSQIATGPVVEEILTRAEQTQTDLLILPTHARAGLSHLVMGSVAEQVARYATVNVLTFCPPEKAGKRHSFLANKLF